MKTTFAFLAGAVLTAFAGLVGGSAPLALIFLIGIGAAIGCGAAALEEKLSGDDELLRDEVK